MLLCCGNFHDSHIHLTAQQTITMLDLSNCKQLSNLTLGLSVIHPDWTPDDGYEWPSFTTVQFSLSFTNPDKPVESQVTDDRWRWLDDYFETTQRNTRVVVAGGYGWEHKWRLLKTAGGFTEADHKEYPLPYGADYLFVQKMPKTAASGRMTFVASWGVC